MPRPFLRRRRQRVPRRDRRWRASPPAGPRAPSTRPRCGPARPRARSRRRCRWPTWPTARAPRWCTCAAPPTRPADGDARRRDDSGAHVDRHRLPDQQGRLPGHQRARDPRRHRPAHPPLRRARAARLRRRRRRADRHRAHQDRRRAGRCRCCRSATRTPCASARPWSRSATPTASTTASPPGIVSAKERVVDRATLHESPTQDLYSFFIQTDASINLGNSGGPLIDANGAVIGVNAAFWAGHPLQPAQGIGFAIPINMAKSLLPRLRDKGDAPRSVLGVDAQPIDSGARGGAQAASRRAAR